jgi:hypothetical protein
MFCINRSLKGTVSRDFRPSVFIHQTIPPGPLIHGLTPFWILLRIRRDMINFRTQKSCMRCHWYRMHRTWGVIDTACTVHAVSLIPHAPYMRCHWYRIHRACGVNDTACILKNRISSRIRIYIWKGFSPLIRGPGRMFWWEKTDGRKSRDAVPLTNELKNIGFPGLWLYIHYSKRLFLCVLTSRLIQSQFPLLFIYYKLN